MATPLRRVYENVRTGQAVLRDAGRVRQIVGVLLRRGFGAVVQHLELQDHWVATTLREWRSSHDVESVPLERRMVEALQELGPTFIKLGQMLSTRPDLFPRAFIQELQTLQDNVPPLPFEDVAAMIRSELGHDVDTLFTDFDREPLATASIAQVHTARVRDGGDDVVVKVQRPNLEAQIGADLEIMGMVARTLEANFPETRAFSPAGMVAEFEKAILREIDFRYELENLARFRVNFADNPRILFPEPYRPLSSGRVLTMQRVRGTKITSLDEHRVDVTAVLRTALDAVLQMIVADGFFHGDLHPGNVLVGDDGTVCFLDVGLVGRLSPRQRDLLTDLLLSVVRHDWQGVARRFWVIASHTRESTADYEVFESDVVEHAERWFAGKTLAQVEFGAVLRDLIGMSLRHRLRLPPDYAMTFKAVITMEGVGKQLQPDLDLFAAARPFMLRVVAERYEPQRLVESGYTALRELTEALGTLPDTTRGILEDLRAGRTTLNFESSQLEALRVNYARTQNRMMLGALSATGAVCGTLALDYGSATFVGLPLLSLTFYALAGVLGAACLLQWPRR